MSMKIEVLQDLLNRFFLIPNGEQQLIVDGRYGDKSMQVTKQYYNEYLKIITQPVEFTDTDRPSTTNFKYKEFNKRGEIPEKYYGNLLKLMNRLEELRKDVAKEVGTSEAATIIIVSGYRPPEYNATLKGAAKNSAHIRAIAADIRTPNLKLDTLHTLCKKHFAEGGTCVYWKHGYVHVDLDYENKRPWHDEKVV